MPGLPQSAASHRDWMKVWSKTNCAYAMWQFIAVNLNVNSTVAGQIACEDKRHKNKTKRREVKWNHSFIRIKWKRNEMKRKEIKSNELNSNQMKWNEMCCVWQLMSGRGRERKRNGVATYIANSLESIGLSILILPQRWKQGKRNDLKTSIEVEIKYY